MKYSIIGTGFMMPRHAQAIIDTGGEICDIVNEMRGKDDWKKMIETTSADCIVIVAPNDLHYDMAMKAADHGKMVLCEKPLAINSMQVKTLQSRPNIFSVLQLRHHPLVSKLKENVQNGKTHRIFMDISVFRDDAYYEGWKGKKERSGGVLFNLGVHYFDLLLYLFGDAKKIKVDFINDKTGKGIIEGDNYLCEWRVSTDEKRDNQRRIYRIDGVDYNFSAKDNLSYENLHKFVYLDLLKGKGITPNEAFKSIELIERIYNSK